MMDPENKSFIETQFPVSKLSKESYKERKANLGQTLTGLGKWWGRKPLVLVRAALLGLLLPATADPRRDREIFLRLMTMDEEGLWRRKSKNIPLKELYARLSEKEREGWFTRTSTPDKPKYRQDIKAKDKLDLQRLVFQSLSYDDKLEYCLRPEHLDGASPEAWDEINPYLGTSAQSLPELIRQLGERRFGHVPRVGDVFCGGGSIPFEAARLGCDVYASDLSPVAVLLTWAALNIVGGGPEVAQKVRAAQEKVYAVVDRQVTEWQIEHNEQGWRADAYLYCLETRCPECGVMVPLASSWVIGEGTKTIAVLKLDEQNKRFDIHIKSGVSAQEVEEAKKSGTVKGNSLHCPVSTCKQPTPFTMLRGDRRTRKGAQYGLRLWENDDLVPRPEDVFQERLYCIRWVETYIEDGKEKTRRHYRAPDAHDLERETKVLALLRERFHDWQDKGYLPSRPIEPGDETTRLMRERGWTYWHHLFNTRQLLAGGLFFETMISLSQKNKIELAGTLLGTGIAIDYNSRLSRCHTAAANEGIVENALYNQAFNTMITYGCRPVSKISNTFFIKIKSCDLKNKLFVEVKDVRIIDFENDIWITDPSYADAINYHELSEFYLSWYEKLLSQVFPEWAIDSKRALAITGKDENFRHNMVAAYRNLTAHMPDDGYQVVMFTHQDVKVWADLALILWAAGLRVTAAWTIGTETESSLKQGNYVQGTVLLVLRKRTSQDTAFRDEISVLIEDEVKAQLDSMLALDDQEDPNFGDTDYQLAAYAAALRVLTQYQKIEDLDIEHELSRPRLRGETSPIEEIIQEAVQTACDYLIPKGFDAQVWKQLTPEERFYLKGLELESHGEQRVGVYQELARGFGVREYQPFLATTQANQTRCKTASEFGNRNLGGDGFGNSLVRQALFAVREAARTREAASGRSWLKTELPDYWNQRKRLVVVLNYLATMALKLESWRQDGEAARLVAGAVENDHI